MEAEIREIESSFIENIEEIHLQRYLEETKPKKRFGPRLKVVLLCLGLSVLTALPFHIMGRRDAQGLFWKIGMPITHDMHLHYEQMKSFYQGLSAGKIYPRWEEDTNLGFGAVTTSYYPPAIYYLTSLFYFLFSNWIIAILLTHLSLMIASGLAMYWYAREYFSVKAASVAMAAYILLPYHLVDQYQRGAIAELLGFIWMPLMMIFADRLMRNRESPFTLNSTTLLHMAGLAASYGAFLWSHPPTAFQFSMGFGLYVLLQTYFKKNWRSLIYVGCGIGLGALLSAAYMLPAFLERHFVRSEYIAKTWPYHGTYIFVHDLPYLDGNRGFFILLDAVWIFSTFVILLCGIFFIFERKTLNKAFQRQVWSWIAIGCFVSFMMVKPSQFIGKWIPGIEIGVFTWRMLGIATFICALIGGACIHIAGGILRRANFERTAAVFLAGLIFVCGTTLSFFAVIRPMVYAPLFIPEKEHWNFATLPIQAPEFPFEDLPRIDRATLASSYNETANGEVQIEKWQPELRLLRVKLNSSDKLQIRTFNFPGWVASIENREIPIITGKTLGEINLELPPGEYQLRLEFTDTPVRQRAELITIGAFIILIALLAISFINRKIKTQIHCPEPK
ncbi:MAG: hypothetical protein AB1757_19125 [Acidobacteriota bacterium]